MYDTMDFINNDNYEDEEEEYERNKAHLWFSELHEKKEIQSDEQKILERKLKKCEEHKLNVLKITGNFIKTIPEDISKFYWLEELYIENTGITAITKKSFPVNLKSLTVKYNNIKFLDCSIFPQSIIKLIFTNNCTLEIVGLLEGIVELDISSNRLSEISCLLPKSLTILDISGNTFFAKLPNLHENITTLDIGNTGIDNIDDLPDNIKYLTTRKCEQLEIVNKLPENLISWIGYYSKLKKITCEFPKKMINFDMCNNNLKYVPAFPPSIENIDLSRNCLESIPIFPPTAQTVDLKLNNCLNIEELKMLKKSLMGISSVKLYFDNMCYDESNMEMMNTLFMSDTSYGYQPFRNEKINDYDTGYTSDNPHYIILTKTYKL
jgi:hypothetical protein